MKTEEQIKEMIGDLQEKLEAQHNNMTEWMQSAMKMQWEAQIDILQWVKE